MDNGYGKGVGDLPCAATRSGFCSSSSSPSYIQPRFLSREQEFGEPMGTYLAHRWLVSETVVDKKNTNVEWVLDFFVIPICSDYLEEKK